jgi:hypothetical protein
MTCEN